MHELPATAFEIARPLFADLATLQVSAGAVLDGECPGRVVVDDPRRPRSAFLTSPEGTFLAGDPDNPPFLVQLRRFVWDRLFGDAGWETMYATTDGSGWKDALEAIAAPRKLVRVDRRHYECMSPAPRWRWLVPEGFAVVPLDAGLLDDEEAVIPQHVGAWIESNWASRDRFLERGFGAVAMDGPAVVSWSVADCRSGDRCEIGIRTLPSYRRRGLATVTVAAAVEHALSVGFRVVGWHCDEDNLGSRGTAEKVGFVLERRYESLWFRRHEPDEPGEQG